LTARDVERATYEWRFGFLGPASGRPGESVFASGEPRKEVEMAHWHRRALTIASTIGFAAVLVPRAALAQNLSPWPYSEYCSDTYHPCFSIEQGSGGGSSALKGMVDTSGYGVLGVAYGSGTPVYGYNLGFGDGVRGEATGANGNGVSGYADSEGIGVYGSAATSGSGVYGTSSSGAGVYGTSSSGYGVYASSGSNYSLYAVNTNKNAIVATNNRNDWSVAVVSSLAAGNGGLAYWGTGGIEITGDAVKPGGGSWSAPSDERVKRDVKDYKSGLDAVMRVRPVTYKYNGLGGTEDDGKEHVGVIAQELEQILPAMVSSRRLPLHSTDREETDVKQVDPSAFTYVLINAVKEQQKLIERQDARIAALEANRRPVLTVSWLGPGSAAGLGMVLGVGGFAAVRRRRRDQAGR
jgi:hypothetical protein